MIAKLSQYGIAGTLLCWIKDFLTGSTHRTKVGDCLSDVAYISSGVVQGSCLGPLLFLLYVNDICDVFTNTVTLKLYADDIKLYSNVGLSVPATLNELQEQLNCLCRWADDWQLPISYSKCNVLTIGKINDCNLQATLDGIIIDCPKLVTDLGVAYDGKLSFSTHIATIAAKAHRRASLIQRCFVSRNTHSLLTAFNVYVRPQLEYCSVVWSPHLKKDIELIEKVQRRFTKRLPGMKNLTYEQRLAKLKLDSLELRRIRADSIWTYKLIFGQLHIDSKAFFSIRYDQSRRGRGHSYKLYLPPCSSSARFNFFTYRVINAWNNLPPETDFGSLYTFKRGLNSKILSHFCKVNFL